MRMKIFFLKWNIKEKEMFVHIHKWKYKQKLMYPIKWLQVFNITISTSWKQNSPATKNLQVETLPHFRLGKMPWPGLSTVQIHTTNDTETAHQFQHYDDKIYPNGDVMSTCASQQLVAKIFFSEVRPKVTFSVARWQT